MSRCDEPMLVIHSNGQFLGSTPRLACQGAKKWKLLCASHFSHAGGYLNLEAAALD